MNQGRRHPIWSWVIHTPWVLALLGLMGVVVFFGSGSGNPLLERLLLSRLDRATGGTAEMRSLSIRWLAMRVTIHGLVIHGNEPAGAEPLFTAAQVEAALRIDSFWGRRISFDELLLRQPHVHVLVGKNGVSNVPTPRRPRSAKRPWNETLFQQRPLYLGNLEWHTVELDSKRYMPLPVGVTARFTIWRDGLALEQGVLRAGHSRFDAQADMTDFADPKWNYRYRGWVELLDFRDTLRNPKIPTGQVDLHGEGQFADGQLKGSGTYSTEDVALSYEIFHAKGLTSRGSYRMDNAGVEIPDFFAGAFGGAVSGRVNMHWEGWKFRAQTHVADMQLAPILPSIEHRNFPVNELHWNARISADSVETWTGPFRNFEVSATSVWDYPEPPAANHEPVRGSWQLHYRYDPNTLFIGAGQFETPSSHGTVDGLLAPRNSALNVKFETQSLGAYKDFIMGRQDYRPIFRRHVSRPCPGGKCPL